jgi:hypothetical protein
MFDILILAYVFFVVLVASDRLFRYIARRLAAQRQINERLAAI